ncbi:MAG: porin family protein [Magnetospirillum sp.]|nr:porin family protein [Magnetospirillum sp.]
MRLIVVASTALLVLPPMAMAQQAPGAQQASGTGQASGAQEAPNSQQASGGGGGETQKPLIDAPYVSGSLGWHMPLDESIDNVDTSVRRGDGFALHGAIGHQYRQWRAEAELGWYRGGAGTNDGQSDTASAMVNAYYDFDTGTGFSPFVGGGVGLGWIDYSNVNVAGLGSINDNQVGLAWQLMAGLGYSLTDALMLYGDYRWFDIANVKMETAAGYQAKFADFGSHNVELGIRYRF